MTHDRRAETWFIARFIRSSAARSFMLSRLGLAPRLRMQRADVIRRNAEYDVIFERLDNRRIQIIAANPAARWLEGIITSTPEYFTFTSSADAARLWPED